MRKFVAAFTAVGVLALTSAIVMGANETVHELSHGGSVDSGEIRWGGSTKYSTAWSHAVTTWNAMGKVTIAPDTASTYEDLTISDVSKSSETWTGLYTNSIGADTIQFNTANMDKAGRTDDHNKKTATHELGHALSIGDHYESTYSTIIMYGVASSETTLKQHDKDDYTSIYP